MADIGRLQSEVSDLVRERLGEAVGNVSVEPEATEDGDEFLVVRIGLAAREIEDETLLGLLEAIESRVAELDERYPSVRFQEAA